MSDEDFTTLRLPKGVHVDMFGGNCPVQAEGWFEADGNKHRFYFRARGQSVTCDVTIDPSKGDPLSLKNDEVWHWGFSYGKAFHAGWIEPEFALGCLAEAYSLFMGVCPRDEVPQIEWGTRRDSTDD